MRDGDGVSLNLRWTTPRIYSTVKLSLERYADNAGEDDIFRNQF